MMAVILSTVILSTCCSLSLLHSLSLESGWKASERERSADPNLPQSRPVYDHSL